MALQQLKKDEEGADSRASSPQIPTHQQHMSTNMNTKSLFNYNFYYNYNIL
jgi:hypothetical protein